MSCTENNDLCGKYATKVFLLECIIETRSLIGWSEFRSILAQTFEHQFENLTDSIFKKSWLVT